jgi:hypothetical protein
MSNECKLRVRRRGDFVETYTATRAGAGVIFCRAGNAITSRGEFAFPRDVAADVAEWDRIYERLGGVAIYDEDGDQVL